MVSLEDRIDTVAACTDHELGYAIWTGITIPVEWIPALIVVFVPRKSDLHAVLCEKLPPGEELGRVAILGGAIDRTVEVDKRAGHRVGFQVMRQPLVLRRAG